MHQNRSTVTGGFIDCQITESTQRFSSKILSCKNVVRPAKTSIVKSKENIFFNAKEKVKTLSWNRAFVKNLGAVAATFELNIPAFPHLPISHGCNGPDDSWLMQRARNHYSISSVSLSCSFQWAAPHLSPHTVLVIEITVMPIAEASKWIIEQL